MLVSIIVPTKNEEKNLEKCLKSIKKQSFLISQIEIVVVDNNSFDKTREIALNYTQKVFKKGPERSAQRNFGVNNAEGKYILYLDADMSVSFDLVFECFQKMESDYDLVALYVPEIILGKGFWIKVRNFERSFYDETVVDGLRFIRKEKFLEVGGFDEKLYACEDWDLDKRIKKIGKVSKVQNPIYHNEDDFSLKKYLKKKAYYSKNFHNYIKKWGKDDEDVRKQFGFWYRYFGVFLENGKWKKILLHPILTSGMYFLRFLVGIKYLRSKALASKISVLPEQR